MRSLWWFFAVLSCVPQQALQPDPVDADGDGAFDLLTGGADCDDADPDIFPGATELCDGLDQNCDGLVDERVELKFAADVDDDGFGASAGPFAYGCTAPDGFVADVDDCDDQDGAIFPGATEDCDGVDQDCDGTVDAGLPHIAYDDLDGDGFGDPTTVAIACEPEAGTVSDGSDCDDDDKDVHPGAPELCDGEDQDCDHAIDEEVVLVRVHPDEDEDGFGDAGTARYACAPEVGEVTDGSDCDDDDEGVNPDAVEVCDGLDQDCDDQPDDGLFDLYHPDLDDDGFGDPTVTLYRCEASAGETKDGSDCDDDAKTVHPGAVEVCDTVDQDCDGATDEGKLLSLHPDRDGDTFGDANETVEACSATSTLVANAQDCDDDDKNVKPGAVETCDERDEDCDTLVDEGAAGGASWFVDGDKDGYGTGTATIACAAPTGRVAFAGDCDDTRIGVSPAGTEVCDTLDNNCNGSIDESPDGRTACP